MKWLCVVALVGCNQIFDLDETDLVTDDRDGDGLLDVIDNCPDVANPLQENQDGDAFGDVCDECPQGSNHNEDGDTFLDGCDNCPQLPNDDQANADGDELGDVCDHDVRAQRRLIFDGFETLSIAWIPGQADWVADEDSVHPVEPPVSADPGLWNRRIEVGGASYFLETRIQVDEVDGVAAGMWTRQRPGFSEFQCYVGRSNGAWTLVIAFPTTGMSATLPLAGLPSNPFVLRLRRDGTLLYCELGEARISIDIVDPVTFPGLFTTAATTRYLSIDAVTSD